MPASRYDVVPTDFDGRVQKIEVMLADRGGRQVRGLLTLAVDVLRRTIIERVNEDYNHNYRIRRPINANRRIEIQPYVRDVITERDWSLHRYIRLGQLNWEILQEVINLQSGK